MWARDRRRRAPRRLRRRRRGLGGRLSGALAVDRRGGAGDLRRARVLDLPPRRRGGRARLRGRCGRGVAVPRRRADPVDDWRRGLGARHAPAARPRGRRRRSTLRPGSGREHRLCAARADGGSAAARGARTRRARGARPPPPGCLQPGRDRSPQPLRWSGRDRARPTAQSASRPGRDRDARRRPRSRRASRRVGLCARGAGAYGRPALARLACRPPPSYSHELSRAATAAARLGSLLDLRPPRLGAAHLGPADLGATDLGAGDRAMALDVGIVVALPPHVVLCAGSGPLLLVLHGAPSFCLRRRTRLEHLTEFGAQIFPRSRQDVQSSGRADGAAAGPRRDRRDRPGRVESAAAADLPYVVYALAVVVSVASTAFRPAQAALVPGLARTPEELTAANVTATTIESVGIFAGPALGGLLLAASTSAVVFGVTAGAMVWSALLVVRISEPAREPTLGAFAGRLGRVRVGAGATIVERGGRGDHFYVVADGEVEVAADEPVP